MYTCNKHKTMSISTRVMSYYLLVSYRTSDTDQCLFHLIDFKSLFISGKWEKYSNIQPKNLQNLSILLEQSPR